MPIKFGSHERKITIVLYLDRATVAIASVLALTLSMDASPANADPSCFAAATIYRVHTTSKTTGSEEFELGWKVRGKSFSKCVTEAKKADRALHKKYPASQYMLTLSATYGCHYPC